MVREKNYRDRLTTVDAEGERNWIYAKKPKGKFTNWRNWASYFMLAFLFLTPFVEYNGRPLLLINIIERKFILFGSIFWPQDFYLVVFIFLTAIVFIVLFTVAFGRLFCGWVCPQTIFMEMFFRKIEYLIEGDYTKQKKLDKQPWDAEKITKKGLKHFIFLSTAFLIGNTFLAYIIGKDDLFKIITEPVNEHYVGFSSMVIFSLVFYWIFAKFREQVCTIACPYGRLQSVLLDEKSIVVAYDYSRGEPRGKMRKNEEREIGDCIDCKQCVKVCPTGIDIRNGTQMECINCTACIDACDEIMARVDLPKGLIRYDSKLGIETGKKFAWSGRIITYSVVLIAMLGLMTFLMVGRSTIDTTIIKTRGTLYTTVDETTIRNIYNYKIINKSYDDAQVKIKLMDPAGKLQIAGVEGDILVPQEGMVEGVLIIKIDKQELDGLNTKVKIGIYLNDELIETRKTNFLGPTQ